MKTESTGSGRWGMPFAWSKMEQRLWRDLLSEENATKPIWGFSGAPEVFDEELLLHGARLSQYFGSRFDTGRTKWRVGSDEKAVMPLLARGYGGRKELTCWGPNQIMGWLWRRKASGGFLTRSNTVFPSRNRLS